MTFAHALHYLEHVFLSIFISQIAENGVYYAFALPDVSLADSQLLLY